MGAGFFEKARADSETWDLGLARDEGKAITAFSVSGLCSGRPSISDLSSLRSFASCSRPVMNASLHLLASFQLRMPNAYYLVLEANRQKLTLRVSLPAQEAKHSARCPGLGAPFALTLVLSRT